MKRITKAIAEAVASTLVQSKRAEIKELEKKQADFITEIYTLSLSQLIKDAFKKHKGFVNYRSSIRLSGAGLSQGYKYYQLNGEYPVCNSCPVSPVDEKQAGTILSFENEIQTKIDALRDLRVNIEVALVNLRTYANVEKEFPEAFVLLPKTEINTSLVVNLKDIRCKLDNNNC